MNDTANELCLTMKGVALMKLVEAGVRTAIRIADSLGVVDLRELFGEGR